MGMRYTQQGSSKYQELGEGAILTEPKQVNVRERKVTALPQVTATRQRQSLSRTLLSHYYDQF